MIVKTDCMDKLSELGFREGPKYFSKGLLKINKETRAVVINAYGSHGNMYVPDDVIDLVQHNYVEKD